MQTVEVTGSSPFFTNTMLCDCGFLNKQFMSYKIKKEVIEIKEIEVSTLGEAVGFSVKTLRKKFGFSQEDLALKVGIARASISNIEMGRHNITLENLERLCKIFNVKSNEILPF